MVATRGVRGLLTLCDADPQPENVAVVAHGRFNKYVLSSLLHGDATRWEDFQQDNTCINVLERTKPDGGVFKGQEWKALILNDTSHLSEREKTEDQGKVAEPKAVDTFGTAGPNSFGV